jgi:hypothetical protein
VAAFITRAAFYIWPAGRDNEQLEEFDALALIFLAIEAQGGRQSRRQSGAFELGNLMRPGSDQRSRGRYSGNRPFQQQRRPQRDQTFDSRGPDTKIRGSAYQIYERYLALAREAAIAGDRVAAENLYQHAEHYFRVHNASREGNSQSAPRPTPAGADMDGPGQDRSEAAERSQPDWEDGPRGFV